MSARGSEKQPILGSHRHRSSRSFSGRETNGSSELGLLSSSKGEAVDIAFAEKDSRLPEDEVTDEKNMSLALEMSANLLKPIKKYFLTPLGWRPWNEEYEQSPGWRAINSFYPFIVALFLLAAYVVQYGACYSRDHPMYSLFNESKVIFRKYCNENYPAETFKPKFCHHPISNYAFSDVIHFLSFLCGLYVFRHKSALEELSRRAEEAFSMAVKYPRHQKELSKHMKFVLYFGLIWVLLGLSSGICGVLGRMIDCTWSPRWRPGYAAWIKINTGTQMWIATVFMWLGFVLFDVVNVAAATSYAIQCQSIITMINVVNAQVKENMLALRDAVREYYNTGKAVNKLNKQMAIAVSIAEFNFANHAILSAYALGDLYANFNTLSNDRSKGLFVFSTVLSLCLWFSIALVPLVQAVRLTNACKSPVRVAIRLRTQIGREHQGTPTQEIDSFLLFIREQNRRAKLFGIPVISYFVYGICAVGLFAVLLCIEFKAIPLDL